MPQPTETDFIELIGAAYDAGFNPNLWQEFCNRFDRALDGVYVSLHAHDLTVNKNVNACYTKHSDEFVDSYKNYYDSLNPILPSLLRAEIGRPVRTEEVIEMQALLSTEFYNDWMRPQEKIAAGGGVVLFRSATRLLVLGAQVRLSDADIKVPVLIGMLQRLSPHIQRAFAIQRSLLGAASEHLSLLKVVEASPNAAILLDASERPVFCNNKAEELFGAGVLQLSRFGALKIADLRRASAAGTCTVLEVPGKGGFMVKLVPLLGNSSAAANWFAEGHLPETLLTFEPRIANPISAAVRYGLTPAEKELAEALVMGRNLSEHAEARGVSIHTVRNQLRTVFEKTGVNSQSRLVALLTRRER